MSKDFKRLLMMIGPILIGVSIALMSAHFLGKDNPVEQVMEEQVEMLIERDLGLPEGTVQLDFTAPEE